MTPFGRAIVGGGSHSGYQNRVLQHDLKLVTRMKQMLLYRLRRSISWDLPGLSIRISYVEIRAAGYDFGDGKGDSDREKHGCINWKKRPFIRFFFCLTCKKRKLAINNRRKKKRHTINYFRSGFAE